ncbi:cysteine hydrolase family protein [Nitrosospira sp. Nsp13]|jgi:nicotinamidase-related amidase|uniref:cysteine hydrolase family protein n=1 Tax=Nitrosospira sp. Nsp13 TaxID=1855332 RepID=UPI000889067F|nr:isochorismatase family cysteine hydrolase [Nitrosospira sp. Nsp13]SCY58680.1 Nicotinamidase-related amidase [Nitrosospira sp. Nsp13]
MGRGVRKLVDEGLGVDNLQEYKGFYNLARDRLLARAEIAAERFKETKTFEFPTWQFGEPIGTLLKLEVEDCPRFGDIAWVEMDSARTAFLSVDMQVDFCGRHGYVDAMGYDLSLTASALMPVRNCLEAIRGTDIKVIHTREGHEPDLSDAPFNKVLRSKIIGNGVGIGEVPEGGLGRLLVRGQKNWDIHPDVYPVEGEYVLDKAGKGAFGSSNLHMYLKNLSITHIIFAGVTTDVCVHTIMREANDYGYWCMLLKDCTGATDRGNYEAAIKSIKMEGGVFGNVSDSRKFIDAVNRQLR